MPSAVELRELEDDELETRLEEYRRELLNLRFQMATGQLDDYSRLKMAKRNVARVLTVLRDREIALAEGRFAGPVIFEAPLRPPRRTEAVVEEEVDLDDEVEAEAPPAGTDEIEDEATEDDADEEGE